MLWQWSAMKMNKKHHFKDIAKKKWVIQGFNSSLNYIMHGPVSSITLCWKYLDYGYTEQLFTFNKDYLEYHYLEKDFINVGNEFLKKWKDDENYFDELLEENEKLTKISLEINDEAKNSELLEMDDEELFELFHKIAEAYTEPIGISHLLEGISYVVEPMIKSKLSKQLGISHRDKNFIEISSALMQPSRSSWIGEESIDLYYIAEDVISDGKLKKLFEEKDEEDIWANLNEDMKERIADHKERFFYNQLNYIHADGLTEIDYVKEIKKLIVNKTDIQKKIDEEKRRYELNNKKRKELIEEHKLPKEITDLIDLILVCLHWQDDRKKNMLSSIYYLNKILKEISRRFEIPAEMLKRYSWKEFTLEKIKNFDLDDAKARLEHYVVYFKRDRNEMKEEFYTKEDYDLFMEIYGKGQIAETQLHGMCANMGKAMGKVRVCRTKEDISKFEEGEILVTMMTRPEFVPAMKKAAAIIADEGGITSHAAIVSRELGIPCIIGTKTATKTLKDGDIVEVNANHGLVRKVD